MAAAIGGACCNLKFADWLFLPSTLVNRAGLQLDQLPRPPSGTPELLTGLCLSWRFS